MIEQIYELISEMTFKEKLEKEQKRKEETLRSIRRWEEYLKQREEAETLFEGHNTALHKAERNPDLTPGNIDFLRSIRRCLCQGWELSEKRKRELNRLADYE